MSLADEQQITIDSVVQTCPKTSGQQNSSIYQASDDATKLTVSHTSTKAGRKRHMARLDRQVIAADPLTAENEYKTLGMYLVVDEPNFGFSDAEIEDLWAGFSAWFTSIKSSVLGGEH